jgi:DNA-binding transcriptional MerR regulator
VHPDNPMRLKKHYSSREVAALTGLTARQLQWWDARRLFTSSIPSHRTAAGGFTERRYSPVDLLELLALANLRRQGFSVQKIRTLLESLRAHFGIRLYEALDGGGAVTLLTDGREVFARTKTGQFFNLLREPNQPLLAVGEEQRLKALSAKVRRRKRKGASGVSRSERPGPARRRDAE